MKIALVHDWLNGMRGGEKCLEALCELYPQAEIKTLFYEKGKISKAISSHAIQSTWVQKLPLIYSRYRYYLPFFPAAAESINLKDFDLVVSLSQCVAKGVKKRSDATHVCYCFTPMRYAWGFFDEYFGDQNPVLRALIRKTIERMRAWDLRVGSRVDYFVAISDHIKKRIKKCYDRDSIVIFPPCDTDFYVPGQGVAEEKFYLIVSALVPYKKIELAIEAFANTDRQLVIIGDGPQKPKFEKLASKNIKFLGWQPDNVLREYYQKAQALIFPGEEDFGIVPVEAQACGLPVIAYGRGGALETVLDGQTGIFFDEQKAKCLLGAITRFEALNWSRQIIRGNALKFSRERFKGQMKDFIESKLRKVVIA